MGVGELPPGWTWATVGQVCSLSSGDFIARRRYSGDGGRYVVVGAGGPIGRVGESNCDPPALILGRVGAAGNAMLFDEPVFATDNTLIVRPREVIDPRFLFLFLRSVNWTPLQSGSSQPLINQVTVNSLPLALPPIGAQHRIVEWIDGLSSRQREAAAHLAAARNPLSRCRSAILAAACAGRLTVDWREARPTGDSAADELGRTARSDPARRVRRGVAPGGPVDDRLAALDLPASWVLRTNADLLVGAALLDLKDGNHGANHPKTAEFTADGLPFVMAAHVSDYRVHYNDAPRVSGVALERLRVGFAEPGDVILTHKGSVGRVAVNTQSCVLTPQTTYYRPNPGVLDSGYLAWYLGSPQYFSQLAAIMSQTTRDFAPISEQYALTLIVPPLEEQQEISRRVTRLMELAELSDRRLENVGKCLEQAARASLQKAVCGEIRGTDWEAAPLGGCEGSSVGDG